MHRNLSAISSQLSHFIPIRRVGGFGAGSTASETSSGGRRTVSPVASILTTSIPFTEPGGTRMPGCWFGLTVTLALWEAARSGAIARRSIMGGWEREIPVR